MKADTLIVLLAMNEAECIGETVGELRRLLPAVDVLVVDDGSRDETAAIARSAGAAVASHPINLGVAVGESTGLRYALRHHYARAIRMDGDGQHDPASVAELMRALDQGTDVVIGSRFAGTVSYESKGLRRLGSRFLSLLLRLLSGRRISDPTSGFRGFGARAIAYFADTHPHDYPEPESVLMAVKQGLSVAEVPVRMRPRLTGTSSLTPWKSMFYMVKVSFALLLETARSK